ncbi:hypothetical protein ACOME3_000603 [Neoechinorhynchus agilis]
MPPSGRSPRCAQCSLIGQELRRLPRCGHSVCSMCFDGITKAGAACRTCTCKTLYANNPFEHFCEQDFNDSSSEAIQVCSSDDAHRQLREASFERMRNQVSAEKPRICQTERQIEDVDNAVIRHVEHKLNALHVCEKYAKKKEDEMAAREKNRREWLQKTQMRKPNREKISEGCTEKGDCKLLPQ